MNIKERNSRLAFIGWFLVWLKDKDNNLVVKQEGDVVTISNNNCDNIKLYLKDKLDDYLISNHYEYEEDYKRIRKQTFSLLKTENNIVTLNIKNYKFTDWR